MAARDCALLADLLPSIQALVDQPADDPSQLAFPIGEFVRAANGAHESLHQAASQLDCDWTTREAIVSVPAGSTWIGLPADLRAIRQTVEWDNTALRKKRDLACGEWSQLGVREYDCLFKAKDFDHGGQASPSATLRFLRPTPRALTIKVVYDYFPFRLIHGCLPEDGGGAGMKLAAHEPSESGGVLVGVTLFIVKNPRGLPYGGASSVIATWNGETKFATLVGGGGGGFNPPPKSGAIYTSRPDLPRDWERYFVLETGVQLGMKLPSRVVDEWKVARDRAERTAKHRSSTIDRRAAKIVRFRNIAGAGLTGDPINR